MSQNQWTMTSPATRNNQLPQCRQGNSNNFFCPHLYESSGICTLKVYKTSTNLYQNKFITKMNLFKEK